MNWVVKGMNLSMSIYAAEIVLPETAEFLNHSIQYQVDTPGNISQLAQSVVGILW